VFLILFLVSGAEAHSLDMLQQTKQPNTEDIPYVVVHGLRHLVGLSSVESGGSRSLVPPILCRLNGTGIG
jgi:hypothetical protein